MCLVADHLLRVLPVVSQHVLMTKKLTMVWVQIHQRYCHVILVKEHKRLLCYMVNIAGVHKSCSYQLVDPSTIVTVCGVSIMKCLLQMKKEATTILNPFYNPGLAKYVADTWLRLPTSWSFCDPTSFSAVHSWSCC